MKQQWKGFFSGALVTLILVGLIGTAFAANRQEQATLDYTGIKITLDGKAVSPTDANGAAVEPFAIAGTTYLPVRGIASALGLSVEWNQASQTVMLKSGAASTAPTPATTPAPATGAATLGQKNALNSARNYLKLMAFSRDGLIKQLEFEGYSNSEAVYAVDNCGADWNEQAAKKAQDYLDLMSFSREGLISQLEFEGFTTAQAEYGVKAVGY